MAKKENPLGGRSRPAISPEERENQLIALTYDLVEARIREDRKSTRLNCSLDSLAYTTLFRSPKNSSGGDFDRTKWLYFHAEMRVTHSKEVETQWLRKKTPWGVGVDLRSRQKNERINSSL